MKTGIRFIYFICIVGLFSCKKGKEMKTNEGFKYRLYTNQQGPKTELGNYVTVEMVYRNSEDSVLFDSRLHGPIRFRLEKIPFKGSYEDGLTYLSSGDSATFYVPADSMIAYMQNQVESDNAITNLHGIKKGTLLKFDIKLIKIQTETEAEEEILLQLSAKENREKNEIQTYIKKHDFPEKPEADGYYLIIHKEGKGKSVDSGRVVSLQYEGRFLNDSVFDGTGRRGQPYNFISGAHHVIAGWELAMKNMHQGASFTLLVPSSLAYGEAGIRNVQTGTYIVPPFTPLVFDIEIISVEDAPAVSGK